MSEKEAGDSKASISIIIPTYNEAPNIAPMCQRLGQSLNGYEVIFVDDNSSDGTAQEVRRIQEKDIRVKLLVRPAKAGLASAILHGFSLAQGDLITMMDADLSHDPADLPRLIEAIQEADIVVGSRYIKGAQILGWPRLRLLTSRVAILLSKLLLRLPLRDTTSGFAVYRREVIEQAQETLSLRGFKLLLEIVVRCPQAKVKEVPVIFVNRSAGSSKMSLREIRDFVVLCWMLRQAQRRAARQGEVYGQGISG